MLTTELEQGFQDLGIHRTMLATITTGLVVQGGELAVAMAIKPGFDCGSGIEPALPSVLSGLLKGLGESQSVLARLLDRLDGGEASESLTLTRVIVRGS